MYRPVRPYHTSRRERVGKIQRISVYLAAHTTLNIFFITRKEKTVTERKEMLLMLCDCFEIIDVEKTRIVLALKNDDWLDLEDGLQMQCALQENLDYIITRNINDFKNSQVRALLPEDFLKAFGQYE